MGGGGRGDGTVFEVGAGSGTITTLASFNGTDGANPAGGLVMDSSGNLFGTTSTGGSSSDGTVFEVAAGSGTITTLGSFNGTEGQGPAGTLIMDSSGNLYGTASGSSGRGTVFELGQGSGSITTLASFVAPTGANPHAGLVMDPSGNLYGTTPSGGGSGDGAVFELAHGSSTITTLASFNGTDGANPEAGLLMDSSGNLYGTTATGGASGAGTVFELAAGSGAITTLASFDGTNGSDALGGVIMDSNGNLFGTASAGGASGAGTVFELAAGSGTITSLASFSGTDGSSPRASLIRDGSGNLYGTTYVGGASGDGTVFELANGSATITTLASFNGSDGANPLAGLVIDGSGNLYGTTALAGTYKHGTVFEVASGSGTITTLAAFHNEGAFPAGGLIIDSTGNLYGTTIRGGALGDGTVFEVAAGSGTITRLASASGGGGSFPLDSLTMDSSGDLYGTTSMGGAIGLGTVFELPGAAAPIDQWTGANFAVDTNWSDGANWSLGTPPTAGQTALLTMNASVKHFTSTVDAGFTNAVGGLVIDSTWGGTITVNSALTVNGHFSLASGSFGGSGAVTIAGDAMQWTGGQIDVGAGGFTNTGVLNADTTGGNLVLGGAGTLTNDGTINEAGTNALLLENGATLRNTTGATFDLTDNGSVSQSGGGTLTNAGTLEKTGGTGTSVISSSFINSAAITVQAGTLALASAGGTNTGGSLSVSLYATLDLTGGASVAYQGTYTGTGLGTVALSGGTLAVGAGGATFHLAGPLFQWTGGSIDVTSGNLTNTGTINYAGSSDVVLTGAGSLVNKRTMIQTSTGSLVLENGATLENPKTGTYEIMRTGGIAASASGGTLVNAGTLEKSTGSGTSTIATTTFSNTGTVEVVSGTLDISAAVTQVSGSTLAGGTWTLDGSATVHSKLDITSAARFTTLGNAAKVTLNGLNTAFTNLSGLTTIDNGAHFSLLGGASFTTTRALTNKGKLTLGAGSVLTVNGTFRQLLTGSLTIEMGGTNTAPTIGQLVSTTGSVALAGGLNVTSTVVPPKGRSFEIVDNQGGPAVSGTFKGLPEGATFTVRKGAKTMTFQITYAGTDADGNQNVIITRIS
jgi:uncharacterized repeat protein (TIGR03803 family)